jgi:hypothetical protein
MFADGAAVVDASVVKDVAAVSDVPWTLFDRISDVPLFTLGASCVSTVGIAVISVVEVGVAIPCAIPSVALAAAVTFDSAAGESAGATCVGA